MIIQVYDDDMLNGEGLREVVFLQGCPHRCKGCFNPETWEYLKPTPEDDMRTKDFYDHVKDKLKESYIDGITISGGDPFMEQNVEETFELCKLARYFGKTVWIYTGYKYEYLYNKYNYMFAYIDVLCDGKFIESLKSPEKPWVGSSNQRVIDVWKTLLNKNNIVLWEHTPYT